MISTGAFAAEADGLITIGPGHTKTVQCSQQAPLSYAQTGASTGTVTCGPAGGGTTTTSSSSTTSTTSSTTSTTSTTMPTTTTTTIPVNTACPQFLEEPSEGQAFCDTLGTPDPTAGTRSGDLNGVLWGVDRLGGDDNPSQNLIDQWPEVSEDQCGTNKVVSNLNDIVTCGGTTVEASDDNGGQSILSMYPRQPFNFATGTQDVEFNVSDNTGGSHSSWPDFAISNVPVPNPDGSNISDGNLDAPFSVGVDLTGSPTPGCVQAQIWETTDYARSVPAQSNPGCAIEASSSAPLYHAMSGVTNLNHVEILVSAGSMKVYMSDAGTTTMHLIDSATFTLPLTEGVVWLEDQHYNGSKFPPAAQQQNTYAWSDLAFSGPLEPRDLGFDVNDNTAAGPASTMGDAPSGLPSTNLGYAADPVTVSTNADNSPTAADLTAALGALLTFCTEAEDTATVDFSVNGHLNTFNTALTEQPTAEGPDTAATCLALPVPFAQVEAGVNTFTFSEPETPWLNFSNISLVLQGAGGIVQP